MRKGSLLVCLCVTILLVACGDNTDTEVASHAVEKESERESNISSGTIDGSSKQEIENHEETNTDVVKEEANQATEEKQETSNEMLDDKYLIGNVIGKSKGDVILENEKIWVEALYSESGNIVDAQSRYYVCIDSDLNIYKKIIPEVFNGYRMEEYISEDVCLVFSPGADIEYYLVDSEGYIVNSQFINDNEKILGMYKDDSGINIFTALAEETVSSQNIIFNVYDENKNIKFSFSKSELEDKYGTSLNLIYDELLLEGNAYGRNIYRLNDNIYIDTVKNKAFVIMGDGRVHSNGSQIINWNNIVDLDSETVQSYGGIFFNNCAVKANSCLSNNNTFLFDANGHYAIFDIYGNMVCDLVKENTKTTGYTDFYDGYMLIEYENEGRTTFLTVIDSNGEWQFEPIQGTIRYIDKYIPQTGQFVALDNERKNTLLIDKFGNIEELEGMAEKEFVILDNGKEKKYLVWEGVGTNNPQPFRVIYAQ